MTVIRGSMLKDAVDSMVTCLRNGHKIMTFGVGGNAANACHMAAELAGKFEEYEDPLAVVCLNDNTSVITAIANDFGWDYVFSRQVLGLGKPGDIVIGFSISSGAPYLTNALSSAKTKRCKTILLSGTPTPPCQRYCDIVIATGSLVTPYVQEEQLRQLHLLCGTVKRKLVEEGSLVRR